MTRDAWLSLVVDGVVRHDRLRRRFDRQRRSPVFGFGS